MGNVNNICTDKTDTLTKGQIVMESFLFKGKDYQSNEFKNLSTQEKKFFLKTFVII